MKNTPNNAELPDGTPPEDEEARLTNLLAKIHAQFPTEEAAVEEFYRSAAQEGLIKCRYCGSLNLTRNYGDRTNTCKRCNKKTWFTAGTVFERMKLAKAWLTAILLKENKVAISSSKFHRVVGVAQSSASKILTKISMVLQNHMGEDAQAVPSALFIGVICKRSRETPARAHPAVEQEEVERRQRSNRNSSETSSSESIADAEGETSYNSHGSDKVASYPAESIPAITEKILAGTEAEKAALTDEFSEQDKRVYGFLSAKPVHADAISQALGMPAHEVSVSLITLELTGLINRLAGDRYERSARNKSQEFSVQTGNGKDFAVDLKITVAGFSNFVSSHFHGISRKYLQHYLAAYWCHVEREQWHSGALLKACLRFRPISYEEILDYVSPILVKILPCREDPERSL